MLKFLLTIMAFTPVALSFQWEKSGSLKSIGAMERLRENQVFERKENFFFEERLRLATALSEGPFRVEYASDTSFFWQRPNATVVPVPDLTPDSAWNAKWNWHSGSNTSVVHRLDRLNLQATLGSLEVRVGKQVVATGVGQFFAAVSQTQRYPYVFVDTEYQKTEDAFTLLWSGPLQLEARFLPKVGRQKEHNFHVRVKGNKEGYDLALTAGRSDDKPYMALETAGNLSDALLRAECSAYFLNPETIVQGLLGLDYVFSPHWSAKLEGFYNGFGKAKPYVFEPYRHRSAPYRGRWYSALEVAWEAHALLKIYSHLISNLEDPSFLLHLYFNYSLSNDLDVLLGNYQGLGGSADEFGGTMPTAFPGMSLGYSDLTYIALRYYF